MKKIATLAEATDLLSEIQRLIREYGILFMNRRAKNAQLLANLGILEPTQRQIIDDLTAKDYCGGPEPDEKYPWRVVAVFGTSYDSVELYIKFSIGVDGTPVVCLSFHEAERPMKYQFK